MQPPAAELQVDLEFPGPVIAYAWPSLGEQARHSEDRRRCRPGQPAVLHLRRLLNRLLAAVRICDGIGSSAEQQP